LGSERALDTSEGFHNVAAKRRFDILVGLKPCSRFGGEVFIDER
jgi:hypothetical protein